jgi:mannose-6-phosphate isomerase-like protein (cupin superfamily)
MAAIIKKGFAAPDETVEAEKFRADVVSVGDLLVSRCTIEPGWVFSKHGAPAMGIVGSCPDTHSVWLVLTGRFVVKMDGGEAVEYGPGELSSIDPGHDAWVVGDEPCVAIDVSPYPSNV